MFCKKPQPHKNNTYRHLKHCCKVKKDLEVEIEKIKNEKINKLKIFELHKELKAQLEVQLKSKEEEILNLKKQLKK
jgi:hypothetical protein